MIRSVRCDQPSFKTVEFVEGLNIILAERSEVSSDKDSRNGLGKTTLIDILHFCLGAKADKKNRAMAPALKGWTFFVDLTLRGKPYTVSRNTAVPRQVMLDGDFCGLARAA